MQQALSDINRDAHAQFLHPNKMPWDRVSMERELDFLSRSLHGHADEHAKTIAYLYKELAQLAEIERHVATVMLKVIGESEHGVRHPLWHGSGLVGALSCFAAEEIQHANTFHQYVRALSGEDIVITNNLFAERVALFSDDDSPLVKLAALCATAYVGESIITVFETRMKALDPRRESAFTQLLHLHGLDEARHVAVDHFVIDHVLPSLSAGERRRMSELIRATEEFNAALARHCAALVNAHYGLDYTVGNHAAGVQMEMTNGFRAAILADGSIRRVDANLDAATRRLITDFSMSDRVHA